MLPAIVLTSSCPRFLGSAGATGRASCAPTAVANRVRDLDSFPYPAWDLVPLENYWKYGMGLGVNRGRSMPMLATRGCPYQCTFCSNPLMWTTRWLARKPKAVLAEIKHYMEKYGAVNFDFYDLTAIVKKNWIVEFCREILASKLKFSYQLPSGTRSEAIDREVAGLLYASGCRNMTYAPESGSPDTLQRIKKRIKLDAMIDSMQACRKEKISIKANIIVGFPGDTPKDLKNTYRFILQHGCGGSPGHHHSAFQRLSWLGAFHEAAGARQDHQDGR